MAKGIKKCTPPRPASTATPTAKSKRQLIYPNPFSAEEIREIKARAAALDEARKVIDRHQMAIDGLIPPPWLIKLLRPAPAKVDTRTWFVEALGTNKRQPNEGATDYAKRLEKLQPANVTKPWTFKTIRRRLYR